MFKSLIDTDMTYHFSVDVSLRILSIYLGLSLSSLFRLQKVKPKYFVSLTNLNGSEPIFTEGQNNL